MRRQCLCGFCAFVFAFLYELGLILFALQMILLSKPVVQFEVSSPIFDMLIPDICYTLPPLAFASVALALMAQVPSMGSCLVISILTQLHCLGALSRKRPEWHCHFGAILTNVYAAVRACGFESDELLSI